MHLLSFILLSDPVVGGLTFFQVSAWREQDNTSSGNQSIDCPCTRTSFFFFGFTPMRPAWLMFVVQDMLLGGYDWASGKMRCVIETLVLSGSTNLLGCI